MGLKDFRRIPRIGSYVYKRISVPYRFSNVDVERESCSGLSHGDRKFCPYSTDSTTRHALPLSRRLHHSPCPLQKHYKVRNPDHTLAENQTIGRS